MNEKEYIEREKAIDALTERNLVVHMDSVNDGLVASCHRSAQRIIANLPAADVRPVCHGRWVKARGSWCTPGGDPVWECSECGKGTHVYGIEHGTYGADVADGQWVSCPNCGADMRGSNNEQAR